MCVLGVALAPSLAAADTTNYWNGSSGGTGLNGRHADVSRSSLTSSWVQDSDGPCCWELWAGAHPAGSTSLYASWAVGNGYACHNYGTSNIGAMFETPYTVQNVHAYASWTGSPAGIYC